RDIAANRHFLLSSSFVCVVLHLTGPLDLIFSWVFRVLDSNLLTLFQDLIFHVPNRNIFFFFYICDSVLALVMLAGPAFDMDPHLPSNFLSEYWSLTVITTYTCPTPRLGKLVLNGKL
ncbi:hypothetical protein L9F63_003978, partial [Diploptera punctata]